MQKRRCVLEYGKKSESNTKKMKKCRVFLSGLRQNDYFCIENLDKRNICEVKRGWIVAFCREKLITD